MRHLKCAVLGDQGVGKTMLVQDMLELPYNQHKDSVVTQYTCRLVENEETHNAEVWDTSGKENYDSVLSHILPECDVVVLCFSHLSNASFQSISCMWYPTVVHICHLVPVILVGTRSLCGDPSRTREEVTRTDVEELQAQLLCESVYIGPEDPPALILQHALTLQRRDNLPPVETTFFGTIANLDTGSGTNGDAGAIKTWLGLESTADEVSAPPPASARVTEGAVRGFIEPKTEEEGFVVERLPDEWLDALC